MEKTSKKRFAKERLFGGGSDEIWVTFLDANGRTASLPKEQFVKISKEQPWKIKKIIKRLKKAFSKDFFCYII